MLLQGATLADGRTVDVRVRGRAHRRGRRPPARRAPGEETLDLAGFLLLPAAAEPHAHLDKALTADRVLNPAGDLLGAIIAWRAYRPTLTVDDIAAPGRAGGAASWSPTG